jgi:dolichol-phosphate mannosyltransferase
MLVRLLVALVVPITPEEAYHWNYSRHLDWSYYDHPPMLGWSIALSRLVGGDTVLGVRLAPLLFSCGTAVVLAFLGRRLYGDRAAVWTVFLLALEPVASVVGGWAFPDSPLFFFWSLSLTWVWQAIDGKGRSFWLAAGAALGAAMLSKYTAAFLVPSVLCYLLFTRNARRWLATPWPYLAGLVALVVFLPVLYWNWTHSWVSFRFQGSDRFQAVNDFSLSQGFFFLCEQWLAILPFTVPLGVLAVWRGARSAVPAERFLLWMFAPMLVFFTIFGFTPTCHVLWPAPAYLALTVLMAGVVVEGQTELARLYERQSRLLAGTALGFVALALVPARLGLGMPHPREMYGWHEAAVRARQERERLPAGSFYLAIGHRSLPFPSQLAFHLAAPADVHSTSLLGVEALQYRFWDDPDQLVGKDAVVVLEYGQETSSRVQELLARHFNSVEPAGEISIPLAQLPFTARREQRFIFLRAQGYHKANQG